MDWITENWHHVVWAACTLLSLVTGKKLGRRAERRDATARRSSSV